MSENNTVLINFLWETYRPDQREYRQNSVELNPSVGDGKYPAVVQVKVPLQHEYIANSEAIISAQLTAGDEPKPVLTIAGMKYIQDQFDAVLKDAEVVKPDDFKDDSNWHDDEDWGVTTTSIPVPADDEDWSDATETPADEPWNEAEEDWGDKE